MMRHGEAIVAVMLASALVAVPGAHAINREWSAALGFLGGVLFAQAVRAERVVYEPCSTVRIVERPIVEREVIVVDPPCPPCRCERICVRPPPPHCVRRFRPEWYRERVFYRERTWISDHHPRW